jgi:hypothetical protein
MSVPAILDDGAESEISVGKRRLSPHLDASRIFRIGVNGSSLSPPFPSGASTRQFTPRFAPRGFCFCHAAALRSRPISPARTFVNGRCRYGSSVASRATWRNTDPLRAGMRACGLPRLAFRAIPRRAAKPRVRDAGRSR